MDQHQPRDHSQYQPAPVPMTRHHVSVVARPSALSQIFSSLFAIVLLGIVLIVGIVFGLLMGVAGSSMDTAVMSTPYRTGGGWDQVAIIEVNGPIDDYAAEFVRDAANSVRNNRSVKAVVLRVDSPGGGVTASDQIWYEVDQLKNTGLPVVASYGSMAASGGYYISCGASHIMAEQTTITGSIGVIAQVLTFEDLMDKVGVKPITLVATSSPQKDVANDVFRSWTEEDRAKIMTMLDASYDTFRDRVKVGRRATISSETALDAVADGSIFTAQQAMKNGLIDSIGYLDDAIATAERLAGIPAGGASVFRIEPSLSFFGLPGFSAKSAGAMRQPDLFDADRLRSLVNDLASPRLMYLMR